MTLVLDLPDELEAQLRRAAASAGKDVSSFVIEAAQQKAQREEEFDENRLQELADKDPMDAFHYLLAHTPNYRGEANLGPLPDDAIAESYLDAVLGEER